MHLDLTTDETTFKALIHSAPTVADLDGDGRAEVIVGTSLGLLYVLDGEYLCKSPEDSIASTWSGPITDSFPALVLPAGNTGFSRRFFPMQFHEIQAQVGVADVRGGPDLEMLVGDLGGNLVCVNVNGDVLWDARCASKDRSCLRVCPIMIFD